MWYAATRKQFDKVRNDDSILATRTVGVVMDGSGNAGGITKTCTDALRTSLLRERLPLRTMVDIANRIISGRYESTFAGVEVSGDLARVVALGDSTVHLYRNGRLTLMSERNKARLGRGLIAPTFHPVFELQRYDVIIVASDGLNLDPYRIGQIIQRTMLSPEKMAEAMLAAQSEHSDDVSVCCYVHRN